MFPEGQDFRRRQQRVVLLPRQRERVVREAMHAAFLYHAIRAGLDMGIVNAGQLPGVRGDPQGPAASASRTCCSIAGPTPPSGWSNSPRRVGNARRKPRPRNTAWREPAGRGAAEARAGQRHRRLHRADVEEARHNTTGAADHRRAADGRHERRRRSVRRRQDVPAAGGEKRPRDEKGRRLSAAVHGGGEGQGRRRRARPAAKSSWPRSRATSTTSARTSSASCWAATTTR